MTGAKQERNTPQSCPLCQGQGTRVFYQDKRREYFQCGRCSFLFVPAYLHLSPPQEKMRYNLHENSLEDKAYRQMLERLAKPLVEKTPFGARGLDFGSGPVPVFAQLMKMKGYEMACYDPYYAHEPDLLEGPWDFVSMSEVAEHLHRPKEEFERLERALKPGGLLGIMTQLFHDGREFSRWHYIRDMTHVSFFSEESFRYLARHLGMDIDFPGRDIVLMRKKP